MTKGFTPISRRLDDVFIGVKCYPSTITMASNSPSLPLIHHFLFLAIKLRLRNDFSVEKFF